MLTFTDRIYQLRASRASHGDIAHWVLDVLDQLLGLSYSQGTRAEVYLGQGGGRADVLVQEDVVIEVKRGLADEQDDAEVQLKTYFNARRTLNVGVATDGRRWLFYVKSRGVPRLYHEFELPANSSDEHLKDLILVSLQAFRRKTPPPVDARQLCDTLKLGTPTFRLSTELLTEASGRADRFTVERRAWIAEFKSVYPGFDDLCTMLGEGSLDKGYSRLYIRHTYLVVIAKLLAAVRIFDEAELHQMIDRRPGEVLDGTVLLHSGVCVADKDDYFSWVRDPSDDLKTFLRELFLSLVRYDFSSVDEDVFRLLYEEVIDADTRHRIGEFFTPKWLAQFIVERVVTNGQHVVLDPACGSGTFLVESIRRRATLRERAGKLTSSDLQDLVEQTWGFDINPLAVLLSRVNIYLVVSRIAHRNKLPPIPSFTPHVQTADSMSRIRSSRHRTLLAHGTGYYLTMAQQMVPVPPSVASLEEALKVGASLSRVCEGYVSRKAAGQAHKHALDSALTLAPNAYRPALKEIINALRDELEDGDGIWGLVYRNKVVPLFSGQFDCVVGNPPWLVYREMDTGMKAVTDYVLTTYDIKPPSKVKTSFDLAVAFTLASATYLKEGGRLGFVLPRSLVSGLQHLPFLEKTSKGELPIQAQEIHDLQGVSPPPFPHGIPCVAAFFESGGRR